jgi:NTP pyrophosphatase (non-canonical NTP hydrolase)
MMAAKGLAKLAEEMGELQQVVGKKLAYFTTDEHPDGGPPLSERLHDEIADVIAACMFVAQTLGLDVDSIAERSSKKLKLFEKWHEDDSNNDHGVDARGEWE